MAKDEQFNMYCRYTDVCTKRRVSGDMHYNKMESIRERALETPCVHERERERNVR